MNKCKPCPLAGQEQPCLAQIARHPRYCRLIDPESSIYQPGYVAVLLKHTDCPEPVTPPDEAKVPLSVSLGLIARMKACPSWVASASCGCGGANTCLAGKGQRGIVNYQDCFACLREQDALTESHRQSTEASGS